MVDTCRFFSDFPFFLLFGTPCKEGDTYKIIIKRDFNENLCPLFIPCDCLFVIFVFTWESCPDIDFLLYYRNYRRHKKCEKSLQNDKIGRVIELINFFTTTTAAVLLISDSLELFFHFSLYYYHHFIFGTK